MLTVYSIDQAEQWDLIVKSFREYDVYWLSGYVKGFQIHGDGEPLLFFFENDQTRGINVVMKRDVAAVNYFTGIIPEKKYYDFASPYGYGGWLFNRQLSKQETVSFYQEYVDFMKAQHIVCAFTRWHALLQNQDQIFALS